jgi:hypothetical protein
MTAWVVELVDAAETPQVVLIHWPVKSTAVRPAAYGAAKAMRLLANADVELAGSDGPGGGRRWSDHDRHQAPRGPRPADRWDGNGFLIASRVRMALKKAGVSEEEREEFWNDALSRDYDHLLQTVIKWVDAS